MSGEHSQSHAWNGNHQHVQQPLFGDSRFSNVYQMTRNLQSRSGNTRPSYDFSNSSPTAQSPTGLFNQSLLVRQGSGDTDEVDDLRFGASVPYYNQRLDRAATYDARSPLPNAGAPRLKPSVEDTSALEMGREWGREIGRLEAEVSRLEHEVEFRKQEAARYKSERDETRVQLGQANERVANLKGEISGLKAQLLKVTTPELQFRTPVQRRALPSTLSEPLSAPSVSSKLASAAKTPGDEPSPRPLHATAQGAASAGTGETPRITTLALHRPNVAEVVGPLFEKLEEWAGQYAVETITSLRQGGLAGNLSGMVSEMLKDRMWDDLIQKPQLRKMLVVAVLNSHLISFLGAGFLENVEKMSRNHDLTDVKNQMLRVPPQKPGMYNELLERRLEIVKTISENAAYAAQIDEQTKRVTDNIMSLLQVLMPRQSISAANKGLRDLVRDVFWVGQRMALTPREWAVTMAQRGDRWDPHYMVQKNEALRDDPKLTDSNGFHYVVRMGICPSITEKDYSSGSLCLKEACPKTVLLMENPSQKTGFGHANQKTTPGSGGKRK